MDLAAIRRSWRSWIVDDGGEAVPWWHAWVWTLLFCLAVAAGFTAIGLAFAGARRGAATAERIWQWYQINLVISLAVGFTIHFLFLAATRVVGRARLRTMEAWKRSAFYAGVPIVGVSIGWPLAVLWLLGLDLGAWVRAVSRESIAVSFGLSVLVTLVLHQYFAVKSRQLVAEARASEAQLRLLQAQIEPHFLFNTLANVVSLMERDTATAKALLESFVDYLRASLSGFSRERHTLGDEMRLVEAYLAIVRHRMGARLAVRIDVPEELHAMPLPALALQPLVENAVVHGLEPRIEGGCVAVHARAESDRLVLTVEDDGAGIGAAAMTTGTRSPGGGTAVDNIRQRLVGAFGKDAALTLEGVAPRGTRATLRLPLAAPAARA